MDTTALLPWPAYAWPAESGKVLAALQQDKGAVIYLTLPQGTARSVARKAIRMALRQALGQWLGCVADDIVLSASPGNALRIEHPRRAAHLSISHEDGLSVAAIHPRHAMGVDVLAITSPPWANECVALARDYLGPDVATQLAALPKPQHIQAFADAWTRWEATLKSLGQSISEWSPALQDRVDTCKTAGLELPWGYCGAVAARAASVRFQGTR